MPQPIPVLLTLSALSQTSPDEPGDPIRLMTTGQLTPAGEGYILQYKETQPDDAGGETAQDVVLQMEPGRVVMTRLGDFGTSMAFVKGKRFEGVYHTPYGDLDMAVYATKVRCALSPQRGQVQLEYQLDMQGSYAAMNVLKLEYVASEGKKPC
ncbi:MAG: DUF1934 domain-containing protein [Clostridia bacterium]|nr:DUF1934 domain-containing protein [Clostridia bacterium]